jgi:hypothetical protein
VKRALQDFSIRRPVFTPAVSKRRLQDALRSATVRNQATADWLMPGRGLGYLELKDHQWCDLSNRELWDALAHFASGSAAKRARLEALSAAAVNERDKLGAEFAGLGAFSALARVERDPGGFTLVLPAPKTAPTPPSAKLLGDTSEVVVWSDTTGISASVRVPPGSLVSKASFSSEGEGSAFCLWKVRVELSAQMAIPFV